ncbi:MAG TPA: EAL domain-containing protein [Macromonas sp.]|nr:EAL domain-containing protein [Macromonas sp.]
MSTLPEPKNCPLDAGACRRPRFGYGTSISYKIGLLFFVLWSVAAMNIVVVHSMLAELNGVAETVNVAGKLRMLSQKIAFETVKSLQDGGSGGAHNEVAAARALSDYETALHALELGGSAFGYSVRAPSLGLASQLHGLRTDWQEYRRQVEAMLVARGSAPATFASDLGLVTEHATRLLADAEGIVGFLTHESQQAQSHALTQMYVLLVFDVAVLGVAFMVARRKLVHPIRELAQYSRGLADGNYEARIRLTSRDDIGQLADAFNHAAGHIGRLIACIDLDRQNSRQAEMMFRGLAENSMVGVYISQEGAFRFVNPRMAEMFGYEREEMIASVGVFDIVTEMDRPLVEENIRRRLLGEAAEVTYVRRAKRKDGSLFDVEVFGSSMVLDGQRATIGMMHDVTDRMRMERTLRVLSACNRALVMATDEQTLLADICQIVKQAGAYPFVWICYVGEEPGCQVRLTAQAESEEGALAALVEQVQQDGAAWNWGVTGRAIRTGQTVILPNLQSSPRIKPWADFQARHRIVSAMSLPLKAGEVVLGTLTVYSQVPNTFTPDEVRVLEELVGNLAYGIAALRADVARQNYAQRLEHHANHDVLTGLANRNLLSDRLKQAIAAAHRNRHMVAVLLFDLDNFKVINDSLGHASGDALLQVVAARMQASVRETDTVARLGGDEFVMVMPDVQQVEDAAVVARKVHDALAQPFDVAGQRMYIGASIGISLYPQDGEHEEVLLKNVDLAMYRAKQRGRGNYCFYTEEMNALNQERQQMDGELRHALERGEFVLHYQPKVNVDSGAIIGAEALLRWRHPERGLVSPAKFIPLAEETGLIVPIGQWALQEACRQNVAWQQAGFGPIRIAVNLSARQFRTQDLVGMVSQVLQATGMDPAYLELEITESVVMHDVADVIHTLLELKALGLHISLDDFGTGYSSLNYLRRFPLDTLKIDQSFVKGIASSANDTTIIQSIIALAHSLKLGVIAEGVETPEQAVFLRAHACEEMQGYYFSKPLPEPELTLLLERSLASSALVTFPLHLG